MTSDSNPRATTKPADWTASDALVLEGLSGLDELMVNQPGSGREQTVGGRDESNVRNTSSVRPQQDFSLDSVSKSPAVSGFGTARELRAAQERFAAQRRSAARRKEQTQGIGFDPQVKGQVLADSEQVSRSFAKPSFSSPSSSSKSVGSPLSNPVQQKPLSAGVADRPSPPQNRSSSRRTVRVPVPPRETQRSVEQPKQSLSRTEELENLRHRNDGTAVSQSVRESAKSEPRPRTVVPEVIRDRSASTSSPKQPWSTTILLSVLATSLLWSAALYAFWKSSGSDWMHHQINTWFQPVRGEMDRSLDQLQTTDLQLQSEHTALKGRVETVIQLGTLEPAIFTSHSRQKFDELLALGARISPTLPADRDLFKQVKTRVEQAYIRKVAEHKGLAVRQLFPKSGVTSDTKLKSSELLDYLTKLDEPGWDRARAAFLLRRFKDNEKVITSLLQVIRDDTDLQVLFAAWYSLVTLTGYEPVNGFDPGHFLEWWRNDQG